MLFSQSFRSARQCVERVKFNSRPAVLIEFLERRLFLSAAPVLVAWYAMDQGSGLEAVDSSPSHNNGTLQSASSWTAGVDGSGLAFHRISRDHVDVAKSTSLDLTASLSLSAWVKPQFNQHASVIVEKAKADTVDGYELSLSEKGTVLFRLNQATSGDTYRIDSTTQFPADGKTWFQVTATYDGTTMMLYINGVLQSSKAAAVAIPVNKMGLSIGAQANGSRALDGAIDDVRVYSGALSAVAVVALFGTAAIPGDEPLSLLFYGNSYTLGHQAGAGDQLPAPTLISLIAVAAGYKAPIIKNKAIDSKDLAFHLARFATGDVRASLDYVIIQERSTKPTNIGFDSLGDSVRFKSDTLALYKKVHAVAAGASPVLFETWSVPPSDTATLHNYYPSIASPAAAADQMQKELGQYYGEAATVLDTAAGKGATRIALVGDAFQQAGWTGLYDSDQHHASDAGYVLSAMVLYETIYHSDVKTVNLSSFFTRVGLSQSQGRALQAIAETAMSAKTF